MCDAELVHSFRESSAIHVCKYMLEEDAVLSIYDPKVERRTIVTDLTNPDVCSDSDKGQATHFDLPVPFFSRLHEAASSFLFCLQLTVSSPSTPTLTRPPPALTPLSS